jgi:hypothetical protein
MKTMKPWLLLTCALNLAISPGFAHEPGDFHVAAVRGDKDEAPAGVDPRVTISVEGQYRVIRCNGIPNHETGEFPNRNNPNSIAPQNYSFLIPLKPKVAEKPTRLGMHPFGVAVNGVVFDPAAAEWWNRDPRSGWQYEPMHMAGRLGADDNNAHVQPTGAYHYHSVPTGLIQKLSEGRTTMGLIGWAADGFPIYGPYGYSDAKHGKGPLKKMKSSFQLKKGKRPSGPGGDFDGSYVADYEFVDGSGDLDECNGLFGPTPEFPEGVYHYFVTDDFPYIPRSFKGTPDSSFFRQGPPGGGPGGPGGHRGPGGGGHRFGPPPDGQGPPPEGRPREGRSGQG